MTPQAGVAVVGVAPILVLWLMGHPAIIDRGGYRDSLDLSARPDLLNHAVGAALTALFIGAFPPHSLWVAGLGSFAWWLLVELAQTKPRDGRGGHWSWPDVAADAVGAAVGTLVLALIRFGL